VRVTRLEMAPRWATRFSSAWSPGPQKVREIARESNTSWLEPEGCDVQLDWNDPVRTLKVELDQDKARALGLTPPT